MDAHSILQAARAAFEARDRDSVADLLRTLVVSRPVVATPWDTVAHMAAGIGEVNLAVSACQLHIDEAPDDPQRKQVLGATLVRYGRLQAAAKLGQHLVERHPDRAETLHFLGEVLAQLGEPERALQHLHRAVALQTHAAYTWLVIATITTFTATDASLQTLRTLCSNRGLPAPRLGILQYALGKALDDIGDVRSAFAAFSEGARLVRTARPYDRGADRIPLDQTLAHLDRNFFAGLHPSASSASPIFIVGMPRSGTTLVEQILTAHSEIAAGAELGSFRQAAMALPDFLPSSIRAFDSRGPDTWSHLAQAYEHLLAERFGSGVRVVDKTLVHARYVGVLAHTLPQARFIWMRRDPLATAWSCFRTHFGVGQNWSWSLADLAYYSQLMDSLHEHWSRHFSERILSVPYEGLVADPQAWTRRMLEHVNLPYESGLENAHSRRRAVQTASTAQVRRRSTRALQTDGALTNPS